MAGASREACASTPSSDLVRCGNRTRGCLLRGHYGDMPGGCLIATVAAPRSPSIRTLDLPFKGNTGVSVVETSMAASGHLPPEGISPTNFDEVVY